MILEGLHLSAFERHVVGDTHWVCLIVECTQLLSYLLQDTIGIIEIFENTYLHLDIVVVFSELSIIVSEFMITNTVSLLNSDLLSGDAASHDSLEFNQGSNLHWRQIWQLLSIGVESIYTPIFVNILL